MFLLGGQNISVVNNPACGWFEPCGPPFFQASTFFNDVWSSKNGVDWELLTADAPWAARAGLSSVVFKGELYVMGGSYVDDPAIGGTGERVVLNDVWKSRDGVEWVQLTDAAPSAARAGAAVVVKDGYLYLLGGEFGFVGRSPTALLQRRLALEGRCELGAGDGERGLDARDRGTPWTFCGTRSCCSVASVSARIRPTRSGRRTRWTSGVEDGANWNTLSGPPWNATDPGAIKYDFDTGWHQPAPGQRGQAIYTFGGDRETFDFFDPTQWLNVDNDVWRFSLPRRGR